MPVTVVGEDHGVVTVEGLTLAFEVLPRFDENAHAAEGGGPTTPVPGTVTDVRVGEGDEVSAGQILVVLEAMKMEQPLKAHKAGTVTGLSAEVGATVTNGAVVCELKD